MLFRRSLPKEAEIFSQSAQANPIGKRSRYYKSIVLFRALGMLTIVVLIGVLYSFITKTTPSVSTTASTNLNDLPSVRAAENVSVDEKKKKKSKKNDNTTSYDTVASNYVAPSLYVAPSITWANFAPVPDYTYQPGQGIGQISSQIVNTQQNIANQMQTCINNARTGANQIINLKNQQKQVQARIDSMNQQEYDIDTSTDSGQNQRDQMDRKIQSLQDLSDNYDKAISNAQDHYNTSNSDCQDRVSKMKQNRSDEESNLDDAFDKGMDIQIPY